MQQCREMTCNSAYKSKYGRGPSTRPTTLRCDRSRVFPPGRSDLRASPSRGIVPAGHRLALRPAGRFSDRCARSQLRPSRTNVVHRQTLKLKLVTPCLKWVNRVTLTVPGSLLACPDNRTFSEPV